ncbi:hypothetical protein KR044_010382 [Drosophila immigrans]|nr:hypothetical protein KR044_010382 [Drosophila immigrans]
MQAALMLRSKSRVARRRKLRKLGGRLELPSNVATKEIAPFPRYPPESWCAQGRAAWLERGRRCSVQEQQQQQATCHRRWVKRNRIQDASLGGSSDDEDFLGVLRGPSTFANAFLYVGLGTVALGLVIAFVGTGEKGFKTVELRLIGPSLIGLGLICCILRILFCICPSHCISSSKKTRKKNGNKIDADHTTSLLRNESKRVSIARGPSMQPKYPIAHKRSQSKMLNEGMEALRQIATTSLFMQNEQKTAINRVVPIINEPETMDHMGADAPLEMKKLQKALNMCEMSDEEQEIALQLAKRTATTTTAVTSSTTKATTTATTPTTAATANKATTTMSTVDEKPNSKLVRQRVALQQQRQLQQQQRQQQQQHQQLQEQPEHSQSLSSSSTVRDSLDGIVVVEETSLMDTEIAPPTTTAAATLPAPLPSSCSTGAIPRLKSNTAAFSTSAQRPGIATGATPKTTTTPTTNCSNSSNNTRLTSSQSHPTSYDLPPAQPHTYSAAATVRGPLGMSLTGSSSVYAMPASRLSGLTASPTVSTTTTISLLPLPAPPTSSTAGTAMASIPGQVLEPSGIATTSLSILQPLTAAKAATGLTGAMQRPATASSASITASASIFGMEHKSQPSSASATMGGRGSALLPPPQLSASKFEPELVLSPAKLGQ